MPKYVIERELLGAGKLTAEELRGISAKFCIPIRRASGTCEAAGPYP